MAWRIVVMGVSGCGKSTVGAALASALNVRYVEGDSLHPPRNVQLMASGTPLTDDDRAGWLDAVAAELARGDGAVVSCSALKRSYRDRLRRAAPGLRLVYLSGSAELLSRRLQARPGHFMPASLLQSQLDTLEPPAADEAPIVADIADDAGVIVARVQEVLAMQFVKVILETGPDGRARFRDEVVPLDQGKPQARLSALMPSGGLQLRMSPPGFRSEFHCTETPQWLFVLRGQMEIGLQDGSTRVFSPGEHFYSNDTLPAGAAFDATLHGHWSRQLGSEALVTAFVRG